MVFNTVLLKKKQDLCCKQTFLDLIFDQDVKGALVELFVRSVI